MGEINTVELLDYFNIVVWGICLCLRYVIRTSFKKFPSKWTPCLVLILGIILQIFFYGGFTIENIFSGMFSGLLSTVSFEILINMGNKKNKK